MAHTTASRHSTTFPQGSPLISVEHLTRTIATRAQRTVILDDVTFTIPAQSLFALNGPSGSGKSTLLNLLTGIDRPRNCVLWARTHWHAGAAGTWGTRQRRDLSLIYLLVRRCDWEEWD